MNSSKFDNLAQVERLLATLIRWRCREVIVCAGARNAPLIVGLAKSSKLKIYSHFEERSAAFFALGRIKSSGHPVAVITTSGTAAAELLPATIEAHYSGLPLILVTADRPVKYRGTGAPQSIEQVGIFSHYVEKCVDCVGIEDWSFSDWSEKRPLHLNVCLEESSREELLRLEKQMESLKEFEAITVTRNNSEKSDLGLGRNSLIQFLAQAKRPAILVGPLPAHLRSQVEEWLIRSGGPIYLESLSQLAGSQPLGEQKILGGEKSLSLALKRGWCDGIIRIGGVPTTRLWRDLEKLFANIPVINFSHLPFVGLSRESVKVFSVEDLLNSEVKIESTNREWRALQTEAQEELRRLKEQFSQSEVAMLGQLAERLPKSARIYLGNSLPIREWDLNSAEVSQQWWVEGNRGANGIDGQVSTFFGFSENLDPNWAFIGDLTALYDLAAPWALRERPLSNVNLVVINNGGGRIFKQMFGREPLENSHNLKLAGWAEMWKLGFESWSEIPTELSPVSGARVIELSVDSESSAQFWQKWEAWWQNRNE